jgi:hypothetical protein
MMATPIIILLVVMVVSGLGAFWLSSGKTAERPVRVMMFVGYFWLLAFIQLLILATGYYVEYLR